MVSIRIRSAETGDQSHSMAGVGTKKTGTPVAHVAHSAPKIRIASPDEMANSTDGIITKMDPVIQISIEAFHPKRADLLGKRHNLHDPNMKGAGSVMSTPTTAPRQTMINHHCATANGARTNTDRAPSVSGTGALNLSKNLSGWIPTSQTSHDEHIHKKILNAGRSA